MSADMASTLVVFDPVLPIKLEVRTGGTQTPRSVPAGTQTLSSLPAGNKCRGPYQRDANAEAAQGVLYLQRGGPLYPASAGGPYWRDANAKCSKISMLGCQSGACVPRDPGVYGKRLKIPSSEGTERSQIFFLRVFLRLKFRGLPACLQKLEKFTFLKGQNYREFFFLAFLEPALRGLHFQRDIS